MFIFSFFKKLPLKILYSDGKVSNRYYFWKKPVALLCCGLKINLVDSPTKMTHSDARCYVKRLQDAGQNWRLPLKEEWLSLCGSRDAFNATVAFLKKCGVSVDELKEDWYWTGTHSSLPGEEKFYFIKVYGRGAFMPNFEGYPYWVRMVATI